MLKSTQPMKLIKKSILLIPFLSIFLGSLFSPKITFALEPCTSNSDCTAANRDDYTGCQLHRNTSSIGEVYLCTNDPTNDDVTNWDYVPPSQQGDCLEGEVNTALGCISTDISTGGFINDILKLAIGLGGTIALLLILVGVFIITTSAGVPDKLNQGKELITSAVSGLLFIILSIFLLNLIGVEILSIPGF